MIFLLYHDDTACTARISGRVLARISGLRGISLATLSEVLGCARMIGVWS